MRLGFLLPLTFGLLVFHLLGATSLRLGLRERALYALLGVGVYLVTITEMLSAFHAVDTLAVTLLWNLGCMGLVGIKWLMAGQLRAGHSLRVGWKLYRDYDFLSRLLLGIILTLLGLSALLAGFATPNGWDSMTYHLPRVAHWLQNRSIGIYATNCMYQNQHSPFAEWSMLHLTLLQGNDRLDAFVQWISFAGSIIAASLLTEACGGSRRAGVVAAFFVATMPMAIMQASTTENDEVIAFFMLCIAWGSIRAGKDPRFLCVVFVGIALGLALLTKATAYLFAPAFLGGLVLDWWRRGALFSFSRILFIGLVALLLNLGYYARNLESSGTWLGSNRDSGPGYNYMNEIHSPSAILSNVVRNISLEAPQIPAVSGLVFRLVTKAHHLLGLDPADPRTTSYAPTFFIPGAPLEHHCANPLQTLVFILSAGMILAGGRRFGPEVKFLAFSVLIGAFLFCLVLKWQPFHSRLHLPLLMLGMPVAAIALEVIASRLLVLFWILLMLSQALPLILKSPSQPLLASSNIFNRPSDVQRFYYGPYDRPDYEAAIRFFKEDNVKLVGLIGPTNNGGWEYPLFDPDEMNFGYPWRIEAVRVENSYASFETSAVPDAIVLIEDQGGDEVTVHGQTYHRVLHGRIISVYGK